MEMSAELRKALFGTLRTYGIARTREDRPVRHFIASRALAPRRVRSYSELSDFDAYRVIKYVELNFAHRRVALVPTPIHA
jgi:hypothetical protein